MKKLGVLGGMGPAASAEFMVRLTNKTTALRDQDHIPTVLWSDPRVPDRNTSITNGDDLPLPWLIDGVKGLQAAGCDHIVMPCNTAHYWYDHLTPLGTPITHIVDSVAASLGNVNAYNKKIGILGTKSTLDLGLYQNRLKTYGWECIIPIPIDIDHYVQPSIEFIKANQIDLASDLLQIVVHKLINRGAQAIVLGCTELPLAVKQSSEMGVLIINSIDSLVDAVLRKWK